MAFDLRDIYKRGFFFYLKAKFVSKKEDLNSVMNVTNLCLSMFKLEKRNENNGHHSDILFYVD